MVPIRTKRRLDPAFRLSRHTHDQRFILTGNGMPFELLPTVFRCASSVLATTITPDVSLSNRCTTPGVAAPPPRAQWSSKAFSSVLDQCPGDGWVTIPAGLFSTRHA
jgi:hypothetical protein